MKLELAILTFYLVFIVSSWYIIGAVLRERNPTGGWWLYLVQAFAFIALVQVFMRNGVQTPEEVERFTEEMDYRWRWLFNFLAFISGVIDAVNSFVVRFTFVSYIFNHHLGLPALYLDEWLTILVKWYILPHPVAPPRRIVDGDPPPAEDIPPLIDTNPSFMSRMCDWASGGRNALRERWKVVMWHIRNRPNPPQNGEVS